jgi:3-dehydroshikimate dehydratase
MMLYPGLVSVTFKPLPAREIVDLAVKAGLASIEWSSDHHAPHGDLQTACAVGRMTRDADLQVSAYGSYYRLRSDEPSTFEEVLGSAVAMSAPVIRVWAGDRGSAAVDDAERERIASASRRIADMAARENIRIAYEYHGGTLTDTRQSAVALLQAADHPNLSTFWQPAQRVSFEQRSADLEAVTPWLNNIHVFHWGAGGFQDRLTLAEGQTEWSAYLQKIATLPGDRHLSLEFVIGDSREMFLQDAATLKAWLDEINASGRHVPPRYAD